jgi:hypothetical protein
LVRNSQWLPGEFLLPATPPHTPIIPATKEAKAGDRGWSEPRSSEANLGKTLSKKKKKEIHSAAKQRRGYNLI